MIFKKRFKGRWADMLELAGAGLCLWWFGCWAVAAATTNVLTQLAFDARYGLYLALAASGVALIAAGVRVVRPRA